MTWRYRMLVAGLVVLLVLLQFRLWGGDGSLTEVYQLRAQVERQQERLQVLEARNAELAAEVEALKTGLDAVEARARSELGMIKDGETYYQMLDPDRADD